MSYFWLLSLAPVHIHVLHLLLSLCHHPEVFPWSQQQHFNVTVQSGLLVLTEEDLEEISLHVLSCQDPPSLTHNYLLGSTLKSCLLVLYLVHFPKRANAQGTMALGPVNLFSVLVIHWLQLLEVQTQNEMKQGKRHLNVELHRQKSMFSEAAQGQIPQHL